MAHLLQLWFLETANKNLVLNASDTPPLPVYPGRGNPDTI